MAADHNELSQNSLLIGGLFGYFSEWSLRILVIYLNVFSYENSRVLTPQPLQSIRKLRTVACKLQTCMLLKEQTVTQTSCVRSYDLNQMTNHLNLCATAPSAYLSSRKS